MIRLLLLPVLALALVGCGGNSDTADLRKFMEDTQNRPRGRIEPIPVFKPYEFFSYSAAGMRSPFELPVLDDAEMVVSTTDNVSPDTDRPREHLEQFPFGSLSMVGTLKGVDGVLWVLIKDGNGSVVRVREGYYMGQNHGRIVAVNEQRINLIEIVPNGLGGWIERPRTLALDGLGGE
ncbi:pilus assembly protein PilP [Venatoribacter cucullus]|uniref:Pilus assembly protein PilP n=1 Tax=Venatoribacter cucullus TaxID=2661630 RepID=A0A9E8FMA4_9GAMM|nr:pilus assembly protein PilP [Venatoribacter cucullus]QQD22497.1 pilus assembly protein PilP [Oceanospirillaceae bacterium ASx5O]QQD25126.1 pilus assembly protein PilP [Venatoribacter cucullus]UZK04517.1 pilus assembly protein PilP [Venatoribacter cucullus]